ncbi:MAG TPA: ABC transporter permease [Desulfobulbaceae bacterium]|nr:ABC transporter permease [Desulfobulbaceae bacterium]
MKSRSIQARAGAAILQSVPIILLATGTVCLLLFALDFSPIAIIRAMAAGSLTSWLKFSQLLSIWVPLLLCSCGLLFTFRAGLWNIGIEGQVVMGAIGATILLRMNPGFLPPPITIIAAMAAACIGGSLWGLLAGILKSRGGVNEIFGGLGLNFVAQGIILYLIFGPWKRAGIASMSGTDIFARNLWLPTPVGWRVAPAALITAIAVFILSRLFLNHTRFGLKVKAVGLNPEASRLFHIHADRYGLFAIMVGGALAGLAGGLQVTGVYHRLIPSISSGYGYLGLLVVMLANYKSLPVPLITLFFAWLAAGSIQLPIMLRIDSSLSGVIQGACVLSALLVHGLRTRRQG